MGRNETEEINTTLRDEVDRLGKINMDQATTIASLKRALAASKDELETLLKAIRIVDRHTSP